MPHFAHVIITLLGWIIVGKSLIIGLFRLSGEFFFFFVECPALETGVEGGGVNCCLLRCFWNSWRLATCYCLPLYLNCWGWISALGVAYTHVCRGLLYLCAESFAYGGGFNKPIVPRTNLDMLPYKDELIECISNSAGHLKSIFM